MRNITAILMASVATAYMSEMVETVFIKGEDGKPLRINASDYDKDEHGAMINPKDQDSMGVPMTANTVISSPNGPAPASVSPSSIAHSSQPVQTDANGVAMPNDDAGNASPEGQRTVALNPPETPVSAAPQRTVGKIGSKWFVLDAANGEKIEAEGIDNKGYKTDGEAWQAAYPAPATSAASQTPDNA